MARRGEPFVIKDHVFRNKTEAEAFMKGELAKIPIGDEVGAGSDVFSYFKYLYEHYHHALSNGYHVIGLRKNPVPGYATGYVLEVLTEELGTWHGASYIKCFDTPTWQSRFKIALRIYFDENIKPRAQQARHCMADFCMVASPLAYHHHAPTFGKMADEIFHLFTPEEKASQFGYDWKSTEHLKIPDGHISLVRLVQLHEGSRYAWLCKPHHYKTLKEDHTLQYDTLELRLQ